MSAAEKLAKKAGIDLHTIPKNSRLGVLLRKRGVQASGDLQRIVALPRRTLVAGLEDAITLWLRRPSGTMALRPAQAQALEEMHDFRGLLGPLPVGAGKTLITALAGRVLTVEKSLLLIPAKLRNKTIKEFNELKKHWDFEAPYLLNYEMLSHADHAKDLDELAPDLIIADEAHKLKNKKAAVTKRVQRYLAANPDCIFVALSGTITQRSLRDYAHLSQWALGLKLTPLPVKWAVLEEWADCLDEKVDPSKRLKPGRLQDLYDETEREIAILDETKAARSAFRRRLVDTPGVIALDVQGCTAALDIAAKDVPECKDINDAFNHLFSLWETPDGWPITDASSLARHAKEISLGLYYVWDPRPPKDWIQARKEWAQACREILKHNQRNLDSELQVTRAVDHGYYPWAESELRAWHGIRDSFIPNTRAEWISFVPLNATIAWLQNNIGIAWTEHVEFAEKLSQKTKLPYYGKQGLNAAGSPIEDAKGPCIASILANSEGRNLQKYNNNLITSCPSSGARMEQLLGRTHREGQEADEVNVDIFCGSYDQWLSFMRARSDAKYIEESTGQPQKLNKATIDWPSISEIENKQEARWSMRR